MAFAHSLPGRILETDHCCVWDPGILGDSITRQAATLSERF